jgi:S1-C subfamily serine protease
MPHYDYATRRRAPSWLAPVILLVLIGIAVATTAGGVALYRMLFSARGTSGVDPQAQLREVTPPGEKGANEKARIEVLSRVKPSVAFITTFDLRRDSITYDVQQVPAGAGSGFVWNNKGHIVTNYHVIQNADAAQVTLNDGRSSKDYTARVVGVQPDKDLAVLYINAKESDLHPIDLGSSHDLQVGQDVMAIGNPFGLGQTVTKGIVSALGRRIESVANTPIYDVIQTDAPINPGNSGGPLVDSSGRLIGVNTAIYSPSGASAGIGFAIPADEVNRVVTNLIREGKPASRPRLGVQVAEDQFARKHGVEEGALVVGVVRGSPASKTGLRATQFDRSGRITTLGDVLVAVDGQPVKKAADLFDALANHQPGDTVAITYLRDDDRHEVRVELQPAL